MLLLLFLFSGTTAYCFFFKKNPHRQRPPFGAPCNYNALVVAPPFFNYVPFSLVFLFRSFLCSNLHARERHLNLFGAWNYADPSPIVPCSYGNYNFDKLGRVHLSIVGPEVIQTPKAYI